MSRFFATVRHLSPRQIVTRAARIAERAWWRMAKPKAPTANAPPPSPSPHLWGEGARRADEGLERAREIAAGRFTFLSETRVRPSWHAPDASRLWRFHLHSFDYARDLAATGDARTFRELAESWIDANRSLGGDGWHPYTISLRVVNWCEAAIAFRDQLDPAFARKLHDSIYAQARFLARHLEHDVRGNHLLENARALIRAGAFFGDARLMQRGIDVLRVEVPEQILPDGGHFERNPGYHLRVLQVLDDVGVYVDAPWLADALRRMREFRDAIVPPGGRLPLLKDTAFAQLPAPAPQPSRWLEASGFAVMRDDARGDFLIADFGRVCPDYLPAHAHADMFSFELTIGGKPVIVDSGVFEYAEGEWRSWFRSTAAHNTVEVDGRDQSEMWGSFRVGRRAHPRNVSWTENARFAAISGEHDGYAPVVHHRTIAFFPEERAWLVVDRVDGPPGHVARSLVHFHPDASPPAIAPFGASAVAEEEGWYSERFGEKRRNRVLVLMAETPARFGYAISAPGDLAGHGAPPADAQALLRLLR